MACESSSIPAVATRWARHRLSAKQSGRGATGPAEIDHVLLTHLHPDHAGGLIYPDGMAVFPHATVHAAKADADHWFDPTRAAAATGIQRLVHDTVARALAPTATPAGS